MLERLGAVLRLQLVDELLHLVAMGPVEHEHGVLRGDDDDIVDADDRGEMLGRAHVDVRRIHRRRHGREPNCPAHRDRDNSQTAAQLPTSDQPMSAGTTAAFSVRSITA